MINDSKFKRNWASALLFEFKYFLISSIFDLIRSIKVKTKNFLILVLFCGLTEIFFLMNQILSLLLLFQISYFPFTNSYPIGVNLPPLGGGDGVGNFASVVWYRFFKIFNFCPILNFILLFRRYKCLFRISWGGVGRLFKNLCYHFGIYYRNWFQMGYLQISQWIFMRMWYKLIVTYLHFGNLIGYLLISIRWTCRLIRCIVSWYCIFKFWLLIILYVYF